MGAREIARKPEHRDRCWDVCGGHIGCADVGRADGTCIKKHMNSEGTLQPEGSLLAG